MSATPFPNTVTSERAEDWQPIETAPMDGNTVVDVWCRGFRVADAVFADGCWRKHQRGKWPLNRLAVEPTHWMELPSAPARQEEDA